MSTRCRIGIQNENKTITSIYCHHDGYPEYVGKVLVENYKDENKIRKLLSLGDMSSLGTEPIENLRGWEMPTVSPAMKDWFEQYKELRPENMCVIYKTRGEDCPAETSKNMKEYLKDTHECWGEYCYLFRDGEWYLLYGNSNKKLVKNMRCCK